MRARSARLLRDSRDPEFYESDETSAVFVKRIDSLDSTRKTQSQASISSSMVFGLVLVAAVFVGTLGLPAGNNRATADIAGPSPQASLDQVRKMFRAHSAVRLSDDFRTGSASWTPPAKAPRGRDWSFKDGLVRPGGFRIWAESSQLVDYKVEFVGQIEHKAMSWAYRATNGENYYASKLLISKPGPLPSVDLVRYAVINGAEHSRTRLPLPLTVRQDTLYKVELNVRGADFSTRVNGQMVDSWTDSRLPSGGIGFFADAGEVAALRYVTLTDRDTFVGRVLSHFGMIHPAMFPH